jgi:hypothetical protein
MSRAHRVRVSGATGAALIALFHLVAAQESQYRNHREPLHAAGRQEDRIRYVWVTDGEGPDGKDPRRDGKGHQVFKLGPEGAVLMTLGKAGVAGATPDTFNLPSAVLIAPNGDVFVADGHGGNSNARVLKFSKDGRFIKTWGKRGTAPSSTNGSNSAGRAAHSSIGTTHSTWPITSPTRRRIRDSEKASRSAARATAR